MRQRGGRGNPSPLPSSPSAKAKERSSARGICRRTWGGGEILERDKFLPLSGKRKTHEQCWCRKAKSRGKKKASGSVVVAGGKRVLSSRNHTALWKTNSQREARASRSQVSWGKEGLGQRGRCGGKSSSLESKSHRFLGNKSHARSVGVASPNLSRKQWHQVVQVGLP